MYPHDPAALYQQWLQQQQQPAPQYTPPSAFPFGFPSGAQPLAAAPVAQPQYLPPPPAAPVAQPQYLPPPPAFQSSPLLSPALRRPRQPRQQPQPEPGGNEFVSLSIVFLSLLIGAALGAVGVHHRFSAAVDERPSAAVQAAVVP